MPTTHFVEFIGPHLCQLYKLGGGNRTKPLGKNVTGLALHVFHNKADVCQTGNRSRKDNVRIFVVNSLTQGLVYAGVLLTPLGMQG